MYLFYIYIYINNSFFTILIIILTSHENKSSHEEKCTPKEYLYRISTFFSLCFIFIIETLLSISIIYCIYIVCTIVLFEKVAVNV